MKTLALIFALTFFANAGQSQAISAKSAEKAVKNMELTLKSGHHELIESTLINVIQLAKANGFEQVQTLQKEIEEVSLTSESASNRYKAWLVLQVFKQPELLVAAPDYTIEQAEHIFDYLNDQMQQLALNK